MSFYLKKNDYLGKITTSDMSGRNITSCNILVEGNVDIVNNLSVINDVDITGDLDVSGSAVFNMLEVSDNVLLNDTLEVFGSCIFNDNIDIFANCNINSIEVECSSIFKDDLKVLGDVTFSNNLSVSGDVNMVNLSVSGDMNIVDLNVSGNLLLNNGLCIDSLKSSAKLLSNCYFKNSIVILESNTSKLGGEIWCDLSDSNFEGNDTISLEYINFSDLQPTQGIFVNFGLYNSSKNSLISCDTYNLRLSAGVVSNNKIDFQFYSDSGITYGSSGLVKEAKHLKIHYFIVSF